MNILNLLKKINFLIKSKKLNTIVFADSYGGIHHLFFILEKLIKSYKRFMHAPLVPLSKFLPLQSILGWHLWAHLVNKNE